MRTRKNPQTTDSRKQTIRPCGGCVVGLPHLFLPAPRAAPFAVFGGEAARSAWHGKMGKSPSPPGRLADGAGALIMLE